MTTLRDLNREELLWADAELWVDRLLVAVAARHARGRGGPLGLDVAEVRGESIALPAEGAPNSDLVTSRAAARLVWEFLGDATWTGAGDAVRFRAKERWPQLTPEHVAVLDRASADDAPSPAAVSRLWSDVRERSGVALRPLRLQRNKAVAGLTTGQFDNALGQPPPTPFVPAASVVDSTPEPRDFAPDRSWLIAGLLFLFAVLAFGCLAFGGVLTAAAS